jgi:ABC-2 type transport system permease protein
VTTLTGTGRLVRLILRRDRLRLGLWIAAIPGLVLAQAVGVQSLYADQAAIDNYVEFFGDNAALIAFSGPGHGFDDPNIGVVLVNEIQVFGCLAMALMSIFAVNRHTRAEEDSERADLVRAHVVGRHAPTTAAVAVVAVVNVVIGILCAAGTIAVGFPGVGSIALAGSMTAVGLMFAGVAAVAAQIASGSRAVLGLAGTALGAAFVIRAAGDISGNGLSWLSPIGWAQGVRAYADERWWTLALCAATAFALVVAAFWLSTQRDLGSGLRSLRAGPPVAARWLARPAGLAFRLQRGALAGWSLGMFLMGVIFGSIGEDVDRMIEENPAMADFFAQLEGTNLTDSFLATSVTMLALFAGGFAVSSALQLRGEEAAGRVESILAGAVSRPRWAAGHLLIACAGTVAVIAAAGLGLGVAYAVVSGDAAQAPRLLGAALVTVPGVLVLVGVATLLFGLVPRAAPATWAALTLMVLIGFFSDVLQLPGWARDLSPLEHLPSVPAEPLAAAPIVALTALAAALVAAGLWSLRRRDLQLH